jgi:hypothetical protein
LTGICLSIIVLGCVKHHCLVTGLMEIKMAEDIMAIYRNLALKNDDHLDKKAFIQKLSDELFQRANKIVSAPCLVDAEQATAYIKCYCAARMNIYDAGADVPVALSPLAYRSQLSFEDSNKAVLSVYKGRVDLDAVISCAKEVANCAKRPGAQPIVFGAGRAAGAAPSS